MADWMTGWQSESMNKQTNEQAHGGINDDERNVFAGRAGCRRLQLQLRSLPADALFDAYRSADEAAIRKLISSKPIFLDLDNQVNMLISMSANSSWQWQHFGETIHVSDNASVCLCVFESVCNSRAHQSDVSPDPEITSSSYSLLDLQSAPLLQGPCYPCMLVLSLVPREFHAMSDAHHALAQAFALSGAVLTCDLIC